MRRAVPEAGFTLMEAMIAAVVLAVAVVAVSQAIVAGQVQSHHARHIQRATMLAEEAIEWVLALPYDDPGGATSPGPESGETSRETFDNADDYHGFTQSAANLTDLAGEAYPAAFDGFARTITCQYTSITPAGLDTVTGLLVTVTVTDARGGSWSVTRFIPEPVE